MRKKIKKLVLWDFEKSKGEAVTSDKIIEKKRFHPDGLYSERIFGPVKDYVCSCGTYNPNGGICPVCNVRFGPSSLRSSTFAHIQLPTDVINPLFMWSLTSRGKSKTKIDILSIIEYRSFLYIPEDRPDDLIAMDNYKYNYQKLSYEKFKEDESKGVPVEEQVLDINGESVTNTYTKLTNEEKELFLEAYNSKSKFIGAHAIIKLVDWLEEHVSKDEFFDIEEYIRRKEWELIIKFKDKLTIDKILVIPPDLRPMMFTGNSMSVAETLTRLYTTLLTKVNIMKSKTKFIKDVSSLTWKNYEDLQKQVNDIYNEIMDVFGGKTGIIRANILGKRIDYSGRAVIAIDPSLKFNECRVPYHMALEVYKYEFARYVSKKTNKTILVILKDIEESLKLRDYRLIDELEEWIFDKPTLLNRQPTLHQYGMLAFNTKLSSDSTIKISPTCTNAYNADFDGDSADGNVKLKVNGIDVTSELENLADLEI